jgi:hypothetical protein
MTHNIYINIMAARTNFIHLPNRADKMRTLTKSVHGMGIGGVLLDGGRGGQSSYSSVDEYRAVTNRNPQSGRGLADKIGDRLSKLNINKANPKRMRNIVI